jgi:hypothetical protein
MTPHPEICYSTDVKHAREFGVQPREIILPIVANAVSVLRPMSRQGSLGEIA